MRHELWIYEFGEAQRADTARHLHTLRLLWCRHDYRDAAIVDDGEVIEHRATTAPLALDVIARAAREAFMGPPVVFTLGPSLDTPEPPSELDGTIWDGCEEEPDYAEVAAAARAEGFGEDEEPPPVDLGLELEAEPQAHADELAQGPEHELAQGPELVAPPVNDVPLDVVDELAAVAVEHVEAWALSKKASAAPPVETAPLQEEALPPVALAPATVPTAPLCAARGCTGRPGPGPASPELAGLCLGHRGVLIRAARRLGTPHPDAARALRLHGQVTRSTVNLARAAA